MSDNQLVEWIDKCLTCQEKDGNIFENGRNEMKHLGLIQLQFLKIAKELSEKQKESGNYKKQHRMFEGLDISIENPKGSIRSGVDKDGKEWSCELYHHYGYIKGTKGNDKDHIDVFINVGAKKNLPVFVVNQVDVKSKKFDEHKVMLGFNTAEEAEKAYLANYEKGWKGLDSIVQLSMDDFKDWVFKGTKKNPCEIIVK